MTVTERERQTHLKCSAVHDEVVRYELANSLLLVSCRRRMNLGQRMIHLDQRIKVRLVNHAVTKRTRHVGVHLGYTHRHTPGLQTQYRHTPGLQTQYRHTRHVGVHLSYTAETRV